MSDPYRWFSPLGLSVVLFAIVGVLWILVGALSYPLHRRGSEAQYLFVSQRADAAYFGGSPGELVGSDPVLDKFRTMMIAVLAGLLTLAGTMVLFVAWFGLRRGSAWALVSLASSVLVATVLWAVALAPYVKAGVRLAIADVPPFMWVPLVLLLPATTLGWLGVR